MLMTLSGSRCDSVVGGVFELPYLLGRARRSRNILGGETMGVPGSGICTNAAAEGLDRPAGRHDVRPSCGAGQAARRPGTGR
jgi:hypothetical protein